MIKNRFIRTFPPFVGKFEVNVIWTAKTLKNSFSIVTFPRFVQPCSYKNIWAQCQNIRLQLSQ